jgi:hypothetical protein
MKGAKNMKKPIIFRRLLVYPSADENMEEGKIFAPRSFSVNINRTS